MPCQNGIEMASEDSDWLVSFPPPNWNGIRMTKVVTGVAAGNYYKMILHAVVFKLPYFICHALSISYFLSCCFSAPVKAFPEKILLQRIFN
jgi:hypothetical protein